MSNLPFDQILIFVLFIIILFLILYFFRRKPPLKYKAVQKIFTPSERKFFIHLQQAVGNEFYIFAKVRAADVLLPVSAKDRSRWQSAFNKVACKHFDYVLCDAKLSIVAAIELDDASHRRADRVERDIFIEWACKSAGVPLIRIKTAKKYDIGELRSSILRQCKVSKA
ncbi:hypothetical protein NitYY0826_C0228 [Nitratiruptor sp. YY08-26]|uniref:DUF2726 domain-containing protein n=1 Tax=unclassified Nitratiruptor TaxID=2624044 RepID=UPI0019169347|nr:MULTISPECIES: DUF2726 domain-containing protein [unclassified Nitratiruptor]BCD61383.1 hypothetical protein NitYY0813_C0227 [Nitratiruptor sp. YY08-13]BCD65317.1 hypothetical protein NitYY0826_C0228 [Nitratiruptor sp. YY08-26]